jgi:uncharacterized membrane-anchored protein
MSALLLFVLFFQFRATRYISAIYWLAVVLIGVVGTLVTDDLTDNLGISLVTTTVVFTVALAVTFAAWYASEHTLSIHSITTRRREALYWLAVLFTFALGTAGGDLTAERLDVGYWRSAVLFAALIAIVTVAYRRFGLNAVPAFWIAYILTRPLGASLGDYLSQPPDKGGLGLGTVGTSALFLVTILVLGRRPRHRTGRLRQGRPRVPGRVPGEVGLVQSVHGQQQHVVDPAGADVGERGRCGGREQDRRGGGTERDASAGHRTSLDAGPRGSFLAGPHVRAPAAG